ncbi:MAG: RdgB/HAM1 family non-canonical purine NTP pyrophosphatase [Chitinophagaceae bacterium]|nr:RdgB/HAM1 family non-canonical purine NTP pyrophosphatase [Chitinophagaceae bacterium]MCW5927182.1 RdgB/HAM1 family non-canonical purine NTP pyrophosphatase [Chitinophagaceae bacterium]
MQKLIFATNNQHKVNEIRPLLDGHFDIITLKEAGINIDIPEPHDTLEENAREKSSTIYRLTGTACFGEDTGLEVAALKGEPGVKSARYAGENRDFSQNIEKLRQNLAGAEDRSARFRTVISLIISGKEYEFEGICNGRITETARGEGGFGYDPVFVPDGDTRSFAEMPLSDKNRYSHRGRAVQQLVNFLLTNENFV